MKDTQSPAQQIEKEIDMKTWIIYWKMRQGKTLNAVRMALDWYPRIYANFQIYHENEEGKQESIVKFIETFDRLSKIRFSYTPWVIILDEAGINANSKDTFNKENRSLIENALFLAGKVNCSVIWISQRFESIDVNARVLADVILRMNKIQRGKKHPLFVVTKQKQIGSKLKHIQSWKNDTISELKAMKVTYNTLETSKMSRKKDLTEAKKINSKTNLINDK